MENRDLASQELSGLLFSEFDANKPIEWKNDRMSAFLLRAAFNIVRCDEYLSTIPLTRVRPSIHRELYGALRNYALKGDLGFEEHDEWKFWSISCLINDAQYRIAATFDRCIAHWIIKFFRDVEPSHPQKERAAPIEDLLHSWESVKLMTLKISLSSMKQVCDAMPDESGSTLSESLHKSMLSIERISSALWLSGTDTAAGAIRHAQNAYCRRIREVATSGDCLSAYRLIDQLSVCRQDAKGKIYERANNMNDEECLAIVIGRVNDFKHRAIGPNIEEELKEEAKPYLRHIELAITIQALRIVTRFFKAMSACIEKASELGLEASKNNQARTGEVVPFSKAL